MRACPRESFSGPAVAPEGAREEGGNEVGRCGGGPGAPSAPRSDKPPGRELNDCDFLPPGDAVRLRPPSRGVDRSRSSSPARMPGTAYREKTHGAWATSSRWWLRRWLCGRWRCRPPWPDQAMSICLSADSEQVRPAAIGAVVLRASILAGQVTPEKDLGG
jgi:hypothetical protein